MLKFDKLFLETLRHGKEFTRALRNHRYEITDDGSLFLPEQKTLVQGRYEHESSSDGLGLCYDSNIIVTEGLNHIWSTEVNGGSQVTTWYIAIHSGTTTPASNWTAANYASNATEITSSISETVRQTWVGATAASGSTNNTSNKATFTSNTTNVSVWGAAMLSTSTLGGTSGVLLSASKFSAVRTLAASGDTIAIGLTLSATSS